MKITNDMILTAGPTISHKEIEYVTDAVINGWNHHMADYLDKFTSTFADYIGTKYAFPTSSCTGALHLALLGMGIGPGDEVIVPEITWVATASSVKYVGATPVFADIDPETWVMDPKSFEKHITKKTKAVMPVHLYGNPVDMDPVLELAKKHNIYVLEDAAPSIGTIYKGKKTGSMGDAGAFSFQGAKALVAGEGGMYVTNNEELFEKTSFIWRQCRESSRERALCTVAVGYKYNMSNLQAALGLAQTERVEEIVAKKIQIFKWYYERLKDIDMIKMNVEKPDTRNIYWMSSLVLDKDAGISRADFRQRLYERNIDTRPFFFPLSSFPMFESDEKRNPVAWDLPQRSVNLPSGHERTEEEIDYICAHIREVLGVGKSNKISDIQPSGWLAFRDDVENTMSEYKNSSKTDIDKYCLPLESEGRLRPVTADTIDNDEEIRLLAKWREKVLHWFPAKFKVTEEGTKKWTENALIGVKDRILFFVEDGNNIPVGHVGLFRFDYKKRTCEIDNIVRGEDGIFKGAMTRACSALLDWTFDKLNIETAYLGVASDNEVAIKLYERLGFEEIQRMPLMQIEEEGGTSRWIEVIGSPYKEIKRYAVTMKLDKSKWRGLNG